MPATSSASSPCEARLWRSKSVILYFILRETVTVKAEPNVRIRVRGAIIRIQTTETRIRTIIRISRQEGTPTSTTVISISQFHVLQSAPCPVKNGTSGTQGPQTSARSDYSHTDNRNPQTHQKAHEQTRGHHTSHAQERHLRQESSSNHILQH